MFKVLGSIVGHSIFQDGIGFPYLSAVCYWYIQAGEEEALQFLTLRDVGADCCNFVNQVSVTYTLQLCMLVCIATYKYRTSKGLLANVGKT